MSQEKKLIMSSALLLFSAEEDADLKTGEDCLSLETHCFTLGSEECW